MNPRELEEQYERRLQNVLKLHCKIVLADKRTSPMWKMEHLNRIAILIEKERGKNDGR